MRSICLFIFLIGVTRGQEQEQLCNPTCLPDDEFEDGETPTEEWDKFIARLTFLTFTEYSDTYCPDDSGRKVTVYLYDNDVMWDLRFKVYSERQNIEAKTLYDCYCEHNDCKSEDFRKCLADARTEMLNDLDSTITLEIIKLRDQILEELCANLTRV